jgi:hypothetical protein
MNKGNNIRDGTESPYILLPANMDTKSIRVASEEKGKTDRLDKIRQDSPPFLHIDKNDTMENFVSNYLKRNKDPAHFRFFRVPVHVAGETAANLRELFKENPSEEMLDFIRQYEVKPSFKQEGNNKNRFSNYQIHHILNSKKMDTNQATRTPSAHRFNEAMIDWGQLTKFGISRDYLEKSGLLDNMLKGYKTDRLVPVRCNFGSAVLVTDARLSFRQSKEGPVVLAMHGMRREPELEKPYFGHVFSDEDRKNLKETGNMGRQAMISYPGSGEKIPCFVSIDKLTNEVVSIPASRAYIPDEVSGVKLSDFEKEQLREGKPILVEGMISKKGTEFDAVLQVNADKRGIQYTFPNSGQFNKESIGGVELTKKQLEDLTTGKAIFVEDMTTKKGEKTSSFVKLDVNGNPQYTRYNPDSPEGNREIYIPKEMNGTRLTHEDREELRAGKPVFIENMVNRKGEEFSCFVKVDTETGIPRYSNTPDGFNERPAFKVPQEVWGVTLNTTERAQLQDGKPVYVADMTGVNGQKFSCWLKVNERMGQLDYYNENPDRPRQNASQTAAKQSENGAVKETKKQEKAEKSQKPATKRKIS